MDTWRHYTHIITVPTDAPGHEACAHGAEMNRALEQLHGEVDRRMEAALLGAIGRGGLSPGTWAAFTLPPAPASSGESLGRQLRDDARGPYLCETCFDAQTPRVLPGTHTATELDEACCLACWPEDVPHG